jgi:hypothetical protein
VFAEHLKHPIPADLDPGIAQLFADKKMDLPASQARLQLALSSDERNDQSLIDCSTVASSPLLVVVLAGHTHPAAQSLDAYSPLPLSFLSRSVDA